MRARIVLAGKTVTQRFWEKVNKNGPVPTNRPELGPCWIWIAAKNQGYGSFRIGGRYDGRTLLAHVFSYWFYADIPDGFDLDHLCRNPPCVNPEHLEPVTRRENLRRGVGISAVNSRKTECIRGHKFDADNTRITPTGSRRCRACHRIDAEIAQEHGAEKK